MTTPVTVQTPKDQFLDAYEREHAITTRVLRAYPANKLDLRPASKCKTARELAWVFAMERAFMTAALNGAFSNPGPMPASPEPPATMDAILAALDKAHRDFGELVKSTPDAKLMETVKFPIAPKTMGDLSRLQVCWALVTDQIHHRGQFSVYLRIADGKLPSIYGPTADEPWM